MNNLGVKLNTFRWYNWNPSCEWHSNPMNVNRISSNTILVSEYMHIQPHKIDFYSEVYNIPI